MADDFDFNAFFRRTRGYHRLKGNGPGKPILVDHGDVGKQKDSKKRLKLIRELKQRYPNKNPLELAEVFHRYFWRYGTYNLPKQSKNGSIMALTSNEFKKKVKNWLKEYNVSRDQLAEYTPWTRSSIDTYLAPSSGELSEHVKSTIKTAIQRAAVDLKNGKTPTMETVSEDKPSLKDRVKAEREQEEAEKERILKEADDRSDARKAEKKEKKEIIENTDASNSQEEESDDQRIKVKEANYLRVREIVYELNEDSPKNMGIGLKLIVQSIRDSDHKVSVIIAGTKVTLTEG